MRRSFFIVLCVFCASVHAQNWKQVFSAPILVSSAFFHNEREGCIGTGYYEVAGAAQIYYTTDGGSTWTRAAMPNQQMTGQITDIFFRDRLKGWATVKNVPEMGWTGIYRTNDGGRTWSFAYQAPYPTSIRETAKGIFVTDRTLGLLRSNTAGATFSTVLSLSGALGIDFMDDNTGIMSCESIISSPVMITTDGGNTWKPTVAGREAWTPFADPVDRRMYYASERDAAFPPVESTVGVTSDLGATFSNPKYWVGNTITGGIAGSRRCKSAVYLQGQDLSTSSVKGLLRSTDGGLNWINVGGPSNTNDSRFAVTGMGAVVYAFDKAGGVWKTTNGGDGTLTSSVRSATLIRIPSNTFSAKLCDSAVIPIPIRFTGCGDLRITAIAFDNELTLISAPQRLDAADPKFDTIILRYHPKQVGPSTKQIRISFLQSDGAPEDTTIAIKVEGIAIADIPLITTQSGSRSLSYGDISVCGGDSADIIVIANAGCAPMNVTALTVNGSAFTLLSSFKPFTLDPGTSRRFLVYFKPQLITNYTGTVNVRTSYGADAIPVSGKGIQGSRALRLVQPTITATLCDTPEYILILHNISCSDVTFDSLGIDAPFEVLTQINGVSLSTDSTVTFRLRLIPKSVGILVQSLRLYSTTKGERFDTTITIVASITAGAATLSLPTDTIDFGDVSTCSFGEASLTFSNVGCDSLRGNISAVLPADFTLSGATTFVLGRKESASIAFVFTPTQIGLQSSTITIATNGGDRTVILRGVGIDGSGTVEGTANAIGTILTCRDTSFTIWLSNFGCDSVFFDSLIISGTGVSDYQIPTPTINGLAVNDTVSLVGSFTPLFGGPRSATVIFYFHSKLGAKYAVPIGLNGGGIEPSVLQLSMPTTPVLIEASKELVLPLNLQGLTAVPVSRLSAIVRTHTDFITLTRFALSPQYAALANLDTVVAGDSLWLQVRFTTPMILVSGKLGDLYASSFISDTVEATIALTDFALADNIGTTGCLPTSFDSSVIHITLDPNCGDLIISQFLKGQLDLIEIVSMQPNPTTGVISLGLRIPEKYRGTYVVEVFDVHGRQIYGRTMTATDNAATLSLRGPSGTYQVRVTSAGGVVTRNIQLIK